MMGKFRSREFTPPEFMKKSRAKSIGYNTIASTSIDDFELNKYKKIGCTAIFSENKPNLQHQKPQLQAALNAMQKGDELVVEKLVLLGNNPSDVISLIENLFQEGKHLRTLDGVFNTKGLGKSFHPIISLLSELFRLDSSVHKQKLQSTDNKLEKSINLGGRPKTNLETTRLVLQLRNEGNSYRSIRNQTNLALSTICRILKEQTYDPSGLSIPNSN